MNLKIDKLILQVTLHTNPGVEQRIFNAGFFFSIGPGGRIRELWTASVNFVEMEKIFALLADRKVALLSMKDDSEPVANLAQVIIKVLDESIEIGDIQLNGDKFFQNYIDGKNIYLNRAIDIWKDKDELKKLKSISEAKLGPPKCGI